MLQTIEGTEVYVVDFTEMPELPIHGTSVESIYAQALTDAIETGIITEPGKYGITVNRITRTYEIFAINEDHLHKV